MKTREELVKAVGDAAEVGDARAVKINDLRAHDAAKDAYLVRYEAYANYYKDKENEHMRDFDQLELTRKENV